MSDLPYVGQELDIFAHANALEALLVIVRAAISGRRCARGRSGNWSQYALADSERRFAPGSVLSRTRNWLERAAAALAGDPTTSKCEVLIGTTQSLQQDLRFDVVLYIDVLEHIEHDKEELARAARSVEKGGRLIVLSPAHQWLFTAFDKSIGHFRRYDRASLVSCAPKACALTKLWYLDSVGMLASCGNRLLLHQAMPDLRQILFWDRYLVPPSTLLDGMLLHRAGKSILAVWTKE